MNNLRMTVIGGGSVGLGLAASFALAGASVILMARAGSVDTLRTEAITVSGLLGEHSVEPGRIAIEDADHPTLAGLDCDVLVVTTKAYDVADALRPYAAPDAPARPHAIVLMQNGVGSAEAAREVMGPDTPVFSTAMLIGVQRHGLNHVSVNAHSGPVRTGSLLGDDVQAITPMLEVAGRGFLPMVHEPNIQQTIFAKLLFNTCMNPTGALIGRSYGELLENEHSRSLIGHLADETLRVFASSTGYRPAKNGRHYVEDTLIPLVIPRSALHRSSMVQDLESGRRTEIDYLNGAIVRMGREVGIDTPFHQSIVALIHARSQWGQC
ncbi:2-dehydropantoate 2-reductase [Accumulibacter sp.]|uniref:ketopantoate reductase family protein n=1 Tax=Accumulibacter sp. TaxID=2053492 RepID=UPI0028C502BA|nr:2-dehydropantoate 2-reductase [Accumulibacter sp.]